MKKLLCLFLVGLLIASCQNEPQTVGEYEEAGRKAYLDQDYKNARRYLGKAVEMKSSDRDILYYLGLCYQREYMLDSAIFYLKRADLLYPKDRELNSAIYPIAAELKEWELAAKAVAVLITTGDSLQTYRERLADLNVRMENYGAAYFHTRFLLEAEPDNPERYYQLAALANELDSLDVAISLMDRAIERFGPDRRFISFKGIAYAGKGEYETAEKILRPLAESDSATAMDKYRLASALVQQDARPKKIEAYELYLDFRTQMELDSRLDSAMAALREELYPDSQ